MGASGNLMSKSVTVHALTGNKEEKSTLVKRMNVQTRNLKRELLLCILQYILQNLHSVSLNISLCVFL